MILDDITKKYPRAVKFLKEHPNMTIDEANDFLGKEIERLKENIHEMS